MTFGDETASDHVGLDAKVVELAMAIAKSLRWCGESAGL
jgi:hypothetical protein